MWLLSLKEKPIEELLDPKTGLRGAARENFLRSVANFITALLADYHLDPSEIGFTAEPLDRVADFLLEHCHGVNWSECIGNIEKLIKEHGGRKELDQRLDEMASLMEKVEAAMRSIDTYCGMWQLPPEVCEELKKLEQDPCIDDQVVEKVLGSFFRSEGATEEQYRPALEQVKSVIKSLARERKCVRWDHLTQAVKSMADLEKRRQEETARKIRAMATITLDRFLRGQEEELRVEKPVERVPQPAVAAAPGAPAAPSPPPPEKPAVKSEERPPEGRKTVGQILGTEEAGRLVKRVAMTIAQILGLSKKEDIDLVARNTRELIEQECSELYEDECVEYIKPFIKQWWNNIKQRAREERRRTMAEKPAEKPPEERKTIDEILASPEAEGLIRRFGTKIARLLMLTRKEDIDYVVSNTRQLLEDNCKGLTEDECFSYVRLFIAQWWEKLKYERRVKKAVEAIIKRGLAPPGFMTLRIIAERLRREGKILTPVSSRFEYIHAFPTYVDSVEQQFRAMGEIPTRSSSPCVSLGDIASRLVILIFPDTSIGFSDENTICCTNCIMYYRDASTNKVIIKYSMPVPKETRGWRPSFPVG